MSLTTIINKLKKHWIITGISLVVGLLGSFYVLTNGSHYFFKNTLPDLSQNLSKFTNNQDSQIKESDFSILILPFNQFCSDTLDVGQVLGNRFNELNKQRNLGLFIHFQKENKQSNKQYDLIIEGDVNIKTCTASNSNEICIKYEFQNSFTNENLVSLESRSNTLKPFSVNELYKGGLQRNIDQIIFTVLGLINCNKGKIEKAKQNFYYAYDTLEYKNDFVLKKLLNLSVQTKDTLKFKNILKNLESDINIVNNPIKRLKVLAYKLSWTLIDNREIKQLLAPIEEEVKSNNYDLTEESIIVFHMIGEYCSKGLPLVGKHYLEIALSNVLKTEYTQETAKIYTDYGRVLYYLEDYDGAIKALDEALNYYNSELIENDWLIIRTLELKWYAQIDLKQLNEAQKTLDKILFLQLKTEVYTEVANTYLNASDVFLILEDYKKSIKFADLGLSVIEEKNIEVEVKNIISYSFHLIKSYCFKAQGNFKKLHKELSLGLQSANNIKDKEIKCNNKNVILSELIRLDESGEIQMKQQTVKEISILLSECSKYLN